MPQPPLTLLEKLATAHAANLAPGQVVRSGDFITIAPRHVMTHDNTAAVIPKFLEILKRAAASATGHSPLATHRFHDPSQPVFAIDHDIQNVTPENLGKYAKIEAFANEHGVDFYPAGTGISHQVMVEQGYVTPGAMVVGSDSHSNLYGALCCLGTPVVRTDAASLWATGRTWWQVPPVARLTLRGRLQQGVVGKDVIVALCGLFNKDEVLNHAVEFVEGEERGIAAMSMDQRMSIANMTTEWGALVGIFPFDEVLRDYLYSRADYFAAGRRPGVRRPNSRGTYTRADVDRWWGGRAALQSDDGARYAVELELDLATVIPHVSGPNDVKTMHALPDIESRQVRINKAWLMSCVNARYEDLAAAASIVKGKKVAPGVEFYLAAASAEVQQRAQRDGHWTALVEAGAIELPPGCGSCIGLGRGLIKAGEVGISSTNRNFEGRMGDRNGQVYLGSPAVVAASALAGYICSPTKFAATRARTSIRQPTPTSDSGLRTPGLRTAQIIDGFPATVRGRLLWLDKDNLNTDGIYAGKHTYNDKLTPQEMSAVIFENYDPQLRSLARPGDIIVSGLNFGAGSSREQAATALKHFGIPCVIAASFSETYKRNAFNNGFVVFECPELIAFLRSASLIGANAEAELSSPPPPGGRGTGGEFSSPSTASSDAPTPKTQLLADIEIDYRRSTLRFSGREFAFPALSPVAQELVVAGGAEQVVAARLRSST